MNFYQSFFSALLGMTTVFAAAQTIDQERAAKIASRLVNNDVCLAQSGDDKLSQRLRTSSDEPPSYYIFQGKNGRGYAIIASDTHLPTVIGYSKESAIGDMDRMPEGMRHILSFVADATERIRQGEDIHIAPSPSLRQVDFHAVAPLVGSQWSQEAPYNYSCPRSSGVTTVTGCAATAIGQIAYFFHHPVNPVGVNTWNTGDAGIGDKGWQTCDFANYTLDYDQMSDVVTKKSPTETKKQVGDLLYVCGAACNMQYGKSMFGGSASTADDVVDGMVKHLGYDGSKLNFTYEWFYKDADAFHQLFYDEIMSGYPTMMAGYSMSEYQGGHIFVVDGIDSEGLVHVNWGWGGMFDGYFDLALMNPSRYEFNYAERAVTGIRPGTGLEPKLQHLATVEIPLQAQEKTVKMNEEFHVFLGKISNWYAYNHTWKIGIGLFNQKGKMLELLYSTDWTTISVENDGGIKSVTDTIGMSGAGQTIRLSSTYPSGDYSLKVVCMEEGYDKWQLPYALNGSEQNNLPLMIDGNNLHFNQISTDIRKVSDGNTKKTWVVYTVDGCYIKTLHHNQPAQLASLPKGFYVVHEGNKAWKYIRK